MDTKTLNLDNLKAGDEVVVIKPNGSISGSIRVLEWSESHQRWQRILCHAL